MHCIMGMNEVKARQILGEAIHDDGSLGWLKDGEFLEWDTSANPAETDVQLDGWFSADELEAIAWWMKHHTKENINEHHETFNR